MTLRKRGGRRDPQRRDRIARAAVAVVAEHGIDGLTHRRVAEVAGVPLGSTTYHFKTLDELLAVGLEYALEEAAEDLREWSARIAPGTDLAEVAADLVVRRTQDDRARTIVHYELYVAALRRPSLRPLSTKWLEAFTEVFRRSLDDDSARLLAATLDGLMLEALIRGVPVSRGDTQALIQRILHQPRLDASC